MNQFTRGIVLAGTVIFFAISAPAQEALDIELPAPPESGPLGVGSEKIMMWGREISCSYYLSTRPKGDIIVFYQRLFRDEGFKNTLDTNRGEDFKGREIRDVVGREIAEYFDSVGLKEKLDAKIVSVSQQRFKKEDRKINQELVVDLLISEKPDGTHVSIGKHLQPLGSADMDDGLPPIKEVRKYLHKEDAPGRDVAAIPRPPQSIRWGSLELGRSALLTYASKLTVEELKEFYKNQMDYRGWQLIKETAASGALDSYKKATRKRNVSLGSIFGDGGDLSGLVYESHILEFSGKEGKATVTVFPNFMDKKAGSIAQINYEQPR